MKIAGYLKTSLIEWPGKIASVIFTPGCNFRCPFCHNADLVDIDKVVRLPRIEEKRILADLKKRKKWVDGVVVTGGEPTLQENLLKFLKSLKSLGLLIMVQTNGTRPEVINELFINGLIDYIGMDIKGDFENYEKFTNVQLPMTNVQRTMKLLAKGGVEYEFRTTVVPGLHNQENLIILAKQIRKILNTCLARLAAKRAGRQAKYLILNTRWYLQQFQPKNTLDKKYLKVKPYSKEEMESFQKELQKIIPQTLLRGV